MLPFAACLLALASCLPAVVQADSRHGALFENPRHRAPQADVQDPDETTVTQTRTAATGSGGVATSVSTASGNGGPDTIVILISTAAPATPSATTTVPLSDASTSIGSAFLSGSSLDPSAAASLSALSVLSAAAASADGSNSDSLSFTTTVTPTITMSASSAPGASGAAAAKNAKSGSSKIAGLSPGGFVGLLIGVILGLIVIAILCYFLWKWCADAQGRKEWERYQNLGPDSGAYVTGGGGRMGAAAMMGMGGARRPQSEYAESMMSRDNDRGTVDWRGSQAPTMRFTGASRPTSYAGSEAAGYGGRYQRNSYRSDRSEHWQRGEY